MIDKINHYSLTTPASVYDEESLTALELAGRTASKVNELIEDTDKRLKEQTDSLPSQVANAVDKHIHEGAFDEQIDKSLGNLKDRVDNISNSIEEGSTTADVELFDIRLGYDKQPHSTAGESVRHQILSVSRAMCFDGFNYGLHMDELVPNEQYSNSDGNIITGEGCYRSKYLYPCKEYIYLTFSSVGTGFNPYNYIACYDHNMEFIGFSRLTTDQSTGAKPINVTLKGTCFVGFTFIGNIALPTHKGGNMITINHIDNGLLNAIYHPFDKTNKNYMYFKKYWCDNVSTVTTAESFDCVVFPVNGLKQVVSTENNLKNAVFIDGTNNVISNGAEFEQLKCYSTDEYDRGRVYNVPDGAVLCVMNLSNIPTRQGEPITNGVVTLVHQNGTGLNGKRIACVGDSITWLDGKQGYDDTNPFEGWQDELRKRGAIIDTFAWSGEPVATSGGYDGINSKLMSYRTTLFDKKYDIGILFAGSNDARIGSPIGSKTYSYNDIHQNPNTFIGAYGITISGLCVGISKLFCCSLIPSTSASHNYSTDNNYIESIKYVCDISCVSYINLFDTMPIMCGETNKYYYDDTHPNYYGMSQIGRVIAREIERVIE